jgi:hypothetical protein
LNKAANEVKLPALGKMQLVGQQSDGLQTLFFKGLRQADARAKPEESEFLNIISNNWIQIDRR